MNEERREFMKWATCALGLAATSPTTTENNYIIDWTKGEPYTDDPKHIGKLVSGFHNVVLCDGVPIGPVTKCKTGLNGWVEHMVEDEKGNYVIDPNIGFLKAVKYGNIQYFDMRRNRA